MFLFRWEEQVRASNQDDDAVNHERFLNEVRALRAARPDNANPYKGGFDTNRFDSSNEFANRYKGSSEKIM